jgi:hypothetical protein
MTPFVLDGPINQCRRMGSGAETCPGSVRGKISRIYFRADAGFANPEVYQYLEAEGIKYAIRLPELNAKLTCKST